MQYAAFVFVVSAIIYGLAVLVGLSSPIGFAFGFAAGMVITRIGNLSGDASRLERRLEYLEKRR